MEREVTTFQFGGAASGDFDTCPLCGHKLGPVQSAQARARLAAGGSERKEPGQDV